MSSVFKPLILSAALALAGMGAFAQMHHSEEGMQGMQGTQGMHGMKPNPEKMQAMVAKHLAELKTKLKITAAQEGAWTTFTTAMKPPARADFKRPDPAEMDKLSTPERIDAMQKLRTERMTAMNAEMDKRHDAIKAFYATLTPEQKKVFDAEHSRMEQQMHKRWEQHGK